ncbi:hypothetical protein [Aureicoccus marinus]|uniref:Uncharacterized protein n=1 Tax=Aureicoccus marinus TaxID=754435 RepID=A0A2S7T719_9FLAO|nr:hypothetical protein [Aureicoccus marinus]PQJ15317.1 hypothetical protein BST99_05815 [Aureicoccus marinus]
MKFIYHIASDWSDEKIRIIEERIGLKIKAGFSSIQIDEKKYLELLPYLKKWGVLGIKYPKFSNTELIESTLSAKINQHTHGYPMPDIDFGYLNLTYDLSDYSKSSGIGKKQKDAFRLKSVPKPKTKRLFGLGWIYDELFVDVGLYIEVFEPLGIKSRPVLQYKKDKPFDSFVQLILEETDETLDLKDYPIEKCKESGRVKYHPRAQGFYPKYSNIIAPIFKSKEWFGTGAEARKRIFVSQSLRDKLIEMKIDKPSWYVPTR